MKRAKCQVKEATEKRLKIGKNLIKVGIMVSDCSKKVAETNVAAPMSYVKERKKSVTTDPLGNTWHVRKIKIITIENESEGEVDGSVPESSEIKSKDDFPTFDNQPKQPDNLIDSLPSHSVMDSHCHIDFILDRRLGKLNLYTWTRLVQRYPALHHPALKGFIQNFCDPPR